MENKYSDAIRKSINVNMTHDDLLKKCDENNYSDFTGALCLVFDMDPELLYALINRDYIWRPKLQFKHDNIKFACNNTQWLTMPEDSRDSIEEVLSCLYRRRDMYYGEPYEFDEKELELKNNHLNKIEEKYGGLRNYLEIVSTRLWCDKNYLASNYAYIFNSGKVKHLI